MGNPVRITMRHAEANQESGLTACPGGYATRFGGRILGVLCAALLLCLARPASAKTDSVPDWVRSAAAQTTPHYPAETNAVVLLDDITYSVATDGQAVEHRRHVVKILRPQGRDNAVIHIGFDKDTKILSMNVWSIGADGHEYAMKDKDFSDVGLDGDSDMFQDDRFRVARAPGADPGSVVAYEYEQRARPFVTEKTWSFQNEIPRLNQSFTLELPPGYSYRTVWAHHATVPAADLENQRWRWEMNNTAAVDLERVPLAPSADSLAGRMTVHYAGPGLAAAAQSTWKSIGVWFGDLATDRLVATPEVTAKAQELTAGKTDFYDKTEAIGEFVQKQVRYFAVEVGIGGYQPHAAGDVFRHRYGDCKDKATLTAAMLSTVGVHAALMMVDSERGVVDPDAPSLVGNHMIAAIELPVGYTSPRLHSTITAGTGRRYLIFDPTSEKTAFGQLESELQGGYGILLEGPDTQAIQLPVLDPALNTIHRTASFRLDADGVLKGTVTEKRFGDLSEVRREVYAKGDAKQQTDFLDHSLGNDFTSFSATGVKVENVDSLNQDFTLSYSLSADRYAKAMGSLLMVRPRVLGDLDLDTDRKPRTIPINLGETMQATDEYSIELPDGYSVDEVPDPVKLDVGFAAYQSDVQVKGNTLHYQRTYTIREITLPADRYADVQKLAGTIAADEASSAILKKK
jgi:transglutaminase-like putative cysteine protease